MEVVVVTTGALIQRVTTNKPALNFLQAYTLAIPRLLKH